MDERSADLLNGRCDGDCVWSEGLQPPQFDRMHSGLLHRAKFEPD